MVVSEKGTENASVAPTSPLNAATAAASGTASASGALEALRDAVGLAGAGVVYRGLERGRLPVTQLGAPTFQAHGVVHLARVVPWLSTGSSFFTAGRAIHKEAGVFSLATAASADSVSLFWRTSGAPWDEACAVVLAIVAVFDCLGVFWCSGEAPRDGAVVVVLTAAAVADF